MQSRRFAILSLSGLMLSLLCGPIANATTVELVFTGTTGSGTPGGRTLIVSDSVVKTLTLDIQLDVDSQGLRVVGESIEYDRDLLDELNVISFEEIAWSKTNAKGTITNSLLQFTLNLATSQESSGSTQGELYQFEGNGGIGSINGPVSTTLTFARVIFTTNPSNVANDDADIFSGRFAYDGDGEDDGAFALDYTEITPSFENAAVCSNADLDSDGVSDCLENCSLRANTAQVDSDGDGCGNMCDAHYSNDGLIGGADFSIFRSAIITQVFDPSVDADSDGTIGGVEFGVIRAGLFTVAPGPSGKLERNTTLCSGL